MQETAHSKPNSIDSALPSFRHGLPGALERKTGPRFTTQELTVQITTPVLAPMIV